MKDVCLIRYDVTVNQQLIVTALLGLLFGFTTSLHSNFSYLVVVMDANLERPTHVVYN